MSKDEYRYTMVISRTTINKLGIMMYDKVSAVIGELIANAYDADAERVTVTAPLGVYLDSPKGPFEITVEYDGIGMTPQQVNAFYLVVGCDRRKDPKRGSLSPKKGRKVTGRKGIGKLAAFGICSEIEVLTAGGERTDKGLRVAHLTLRLDQIMQETDNPYHPDPAPSDGSFLPVAGTRITLRLFGHRKVPDRETFHRQLAARFGILRDDWRITVVDSSSQDRFDVGELDIKVLEGTRLDLSTLPVELPDGRELPVTGWIAYAKDPYKNEEMAGIRIYARGKIVAQTRDFGLSAGFTGEYKLRSYVVGVIHADWLDEEEDFIRSDRQDILWNSEFGQAFQEWGQRILRDVATRGQKSIRARNWQLFQETSRIQDRVAKAFPQSLELRENVMRAARVLVSGLESEAVQDADHVEALTRLALEIGPHRVLLDKLRDASTNATNTLSAIAELFTTARIAEMYSLGTIANERVNSIKRLERLISVSDAEEKAFQTLIESAPWLVAPDWTVLSSNQTLQTFKDAFLRLWEKNHGVVAAAGDIADPSKRPDYVMINYRGTLNIVEIKRPGHALTDEVFKEGRLLPWPAPTHAERAILCLPPWQAPGSAPIGRSHQGP